MLAAFERWGVSASARALRGMFALRRSGTARERRADLVRDRLGEKPLYYGWIGGALLFGSELRRCAPIPRCRGEIDRDALALLLRHNYVPAPHSIYREIRKLPPGTVLTVRPGARRPPRGSTGTFASSPRTGMRSRAPDHGRSEATDELDALLARRRPREMIADVPLGAFLSGGIDSSTVVALMQAQSAPAGADLHDRLRETRLRRGGARAGRGAASRHRSHRALRHPGRGARRRSRGCRAMYDEPFADSSQIPTFLVVAAGAAARHRRAVRRRRRRAVRRLQPVSSAGRHVAQAGARCRGSVAQRGGARPASRCAPASWGEPGRPRCFPRGAIGTRRGQDAQAGAWASAESMVACICSLVSHLAPSRRRW